MTNALIEIRRVPLPGKEFILAEGVKKSLEATGKSGIVTATSASSHLQTRDVTTAITGLTLSEITEIETAVSNSPEGQARLMALEELCSKVTYQVLVILAASENISLDKAQYINRRYMKAKRGQSQLLIEALLQWRDKFEKKPMLTRPLASDLDIVRLTTPIETLEELAETISTINTNPDHKKNRDAVSELTVSGFQTNNRIIHRI